MKDWENVEADINKILTKHYSKGRGSKKVNKIVVHYNAGNLTVEACYATWQNRKASAQYQVESSGRIGQLVWDKDTAWHCGVFSQNQQSIGIEHANKSDGTITEQCLDNGAHLVAALCKYYGLGRPEWLKNVFPHKYFKATSCPGQIYGSQKDAYIQRAQYWYDVMTGAAQEDTSNPQNPGDPVNNAGLNYRAHVADYGWLDAVHDGQIAGTTGKGKQLEAIKVTPPEGLELNAKIHVEDKGWLEFDGIKKGESSGEGSSSNDPIIGTVGESLRAEAIEFDVVKNETGKTLMYQVHIEDYGWTGWIKAGFAAGTVGIKKRIEAIQMKLV